MAEYRIYINENQIEYRRKVFNKETGMAEYKDYEHSNHRDNTGKKYKMVKVYLPYKNRRTQIHGDDALMFGPDKNGIDRDDRRCYVYTYLERIENVPSANQKNLKMIRFSSGDVQKGRFNVNFIGKQLDVPRGQRSKWEEIEVVRIGVPELRRCFPVNLKQVEQLTPKKNKMKGNSSKEKKDQPRITRSDRKRKTR